ncbi:MAG: S49 family peptidase [candidate division Zixibacteria bacterium]|nr:S49 family peptidase [candidate division Zixibacteria bacterium]
MRRCTTITTVLALCLACVFARNSAAQSIDRIPVPDGVFFHVPAADAFGVEAAWTNPAELARYRARAAMIMADYFDGKVARSWGWAVTGDHVTSAYRYLDRPDGIYKEWIWAAGFPVMSGIQAGVSYRYFSDGPGFYNNRHFWNIGVSGAYGPKVRWGALFSNLNRGRVDGDRTETEMRYSLALQPFGPKATLAADMLLSTGTSTSDADWIYHGTYTPIRGLYLYGSLDSHHNFMLGFRTNLVEYFAGARSRFTDEGDGRGTIAFVGLTNHRQTSIINQPKRRLALALSGEQPENPPRPVFGPQTEPFATLLTTIYRAAEDPSISAMILDLKRLRLGLAQAQELRSALHFFRDHGKPVTCYVQDANNIAYYVASVCDDILIPPVSRVNLVGLRAELTFYAGTLDKLGINVELLRIGDYKSGAEPFTRSSASPEYREQVDRLLDETYDQFVDGIARGRGLSPDSVRALIDQGPYTSEDALAAGLVDGLLYRDRLIGEYLTGQPQVSFKHYLRDTLLNDSWTPRPKIAVVVADGDVVDRLASMPFLAGEGVTPGAMAGALRQAAGDRSIKGIVFRVNSPGGEALAGESIHRAVDLAARQKPLVVSMANVSASAAYYFSMPAHRLFADEGSITGSIGIFGGKADLSGLYEKIALHKELYTRGQYAGMMTASRPFTDDERAKYFYQLQAFYNHFVDLVSDNRSLSRDSVDALGQGRVFSGRDALQAGLVDEIGGLKQALEYTASQLGLDDYDIVVYPERRPLFILPGGSLVRAAASILARGDTSPDKLWSSTVSTDDGPTLLARLPFDVTIE